MSLALRLTNHVLETEYSCFFLSVDINPYSKNNLRHATHNWKKICVCLKYKTERMIETEIMYLIGKETYVKSKKK